jgi:hypothetical protein
MRALVFLSLLAVALGFTNRNLNLNSNQQHAFFSKAKANKANDGTTGTGLFMAMPWQKELLSPEQAALQQQLRNKDYLAAKQRAERFRQAEDAQRLADESRARMFQASGTTPSAAESKNARKKQPSKIEKEATVLAVLRALYVPWLGLLSKRFK